MRYEDLTGRRFGRLTVREFNNSDGENRHWLCDCDCGKTKITTTNSLTQGKVKSCGCYRLESVRTNSITHGDYIKTSHYRGILSVYKGMKQRCYNENSTFYKDYGGRGINVCDEWLHSYEDFKLWAISNGYKPGLTIDRIDNNGNYGPSNCRWVTRKIQANNRRSNHLVTIGEETHTIKEWSIIKGVNRKTIHTRIARGWDEVVAITTPVK